MTLLAFLPLLAISIAAFEYKDVHIGTGYAAKNTCTGIWVTGVDEPIMRDDYVAPEVAPLPIIWDVAVDRQHRMVRASAPGDVSEAVYRPGLGTTLTTGTTRAELLKVQPTLLTLTLPSDLPWPHGTGDIHPNLPENVDYKAIEAAMDEVFKENQEIPKKTAAVVIIYKGKLIAERYAPQFNASSPILGWSMSKTVTGSLVGMLQERGLLNVNDKAPIDWHAPDTAEKSEITILNLLHMSSGLYFNEKPRGLNNHLGEMLYGQHDYADYMAKRPMRAKPGTVWNYSTGDTMLLSKIVQDALGGSLEDAYHFIQGELFHKIDIATAVVEFDPSGTFVGAASICMSTRDWARLGLLYLNDGRWKGEQILPQGWVAFATTPAPTSPIYGAQLWLNTDQVLHADLPEELVSFRGHNGQRVMIIPSKELIVVRMGYTFNTTYGQNMDQDPVPLLVEQVLSAIGDPVAS
ncbi:MAG: serine hydrolase [Myxococcota bacterium]|nr:serine hydrolase [Myxococcota bacterium]